MVLCFSLYDFLLVAVGRAAANKPAHVKGERHQAKAVYHGDITTYNARADAISALVTGLTQSAFGGRFGGSQTLENPLSPAGCGGTAATTSGKRENLGEAPGTLWVWAPGLPKPHHCV